METQYCPRPPPSPPPTPPPDPSSTEPSDLLLNEESDVLWLSALEIARSVQDPSRGKIEPYHLLLALLYKGIKNIDEVLFRKPPVLDVPLLWKVVHEAGGNPEDLGIDIRQRWLSEVELSSISPEQGLQEQQPTPDSGYLLSSCSSQTKSTLLTAKADLAKTGDAFVAPHHIILALLDDPSVLAVLNDHDLDAERLAALTKRYRPNKVTTRETKPRFFVLEQFASDLTEEAKQGKLDPVVGRDEEIRRLIVILSRRYKCSAVLLGEPGVGKTAIAEGLAWRIFDREVPEELNCRIFSLDMGLLLASTTCHGKLELRVKAILEEIQENEAEGVHVILYIDSLHLITTGRKTGGAGGMDVANLMKPLLARGKIRCFGSSTFHDYKASIEKDGSLVRRFAPIVICEPTAAQTLTILRGLKRRMEEFHRLSITDAALEEAAYLAARYATYKRLPDSAIDLVDEACSMLKVNEVLRPEGLDKLLNRKQILEFDIKSLSSERERNDTDSQKRRVEAQASLGRVRAEIETTEKELAREQAQKNGIIKLEEEIAANSERLKKLEKRTQSMLDAQVIRGKLRQAREKLDRAKLAYRDHPQYPNRVTPAVIAQVISEQTAIPIQSVMSHERPHYISLEEDLSKAVVGQTEATHAITQAIHLSRSGLSNPCRPVASMLLVGGPGTGKTFIAKELARLLFDSDDKLLVINGAEYASALNLNRLIGTPACSGYDHGGELTECIKRKPFCIVLVDNIDKACPEFHIKFRTLIDQGWLEDGDGKVVDFRNCIILMTTVFGSQFITSRRAISHGAQADVIKALGLHFSLDFLNCLDAIIPFLPLSRQNLEQIVEARLEQIRKHLQEKGFMLEVDRRVKEKIVSESDGEAPNARTLLRRLRSEVEDGLGPVLKHFPAPCCLRVEEREGSIQVTRV